MSNLKLKKIPSEISYFYWVKHLDLSKNKIKHLAPLSGLIGLNSLNLAYNRVKNIESLKKLIRLDDLNLIDNELKDISSLSNLLNLKSLHLSLNPLKRADAVFRLQKLENLYLCATKVQKIDRVVNLKNLKNLDVSYANLNDEDMNALCVLLESSEKLKYISEMGRLSTRIKSDLPFREKLERIIDAKLSCSKIE